MKILLTAVQFSPNISGLQRYAFNLVRCLMKQKDVSAVHLVLAPWQRELARTSGLDGMDRVTTYIADMEQSLLGRNLWYYRRLPELVTQLQPDIVHLTYPVPVNAATISCPVVLTLHDLYPYEIPGNFGFPKVFFNRMILQQCMRSVDAVVCVSETTKQGMKQQVPPRTWEKATRIYNCVEAEPVCAKVSPIPDWNNEPFLLAVAQHRKNKNIPLLIEIFYRLLRDNSIDPEMKLVVIGITGPETAHILRLVSKLGLERRVVFLRGLPEPALQWCYTHCEVLVAPSEIEGFGLPVAEALLAGCRVVCSDISAFREIDQQHCRFVALGPNANDKFSMEIVESLREPRTPPVSLPQFSSEILGTQYVSLYRELMLSVNPLQATHYASPIQATTPKRQSL